MKCAAQKNAKNKPCKYVCMLHMHMHFIKFHFFPGHYVCMTANPNVYAGESLLSLPISKLECGNLGGGNLLGDLPVAAIAAPASLLFLIIVIVIVVIARKRHGKKGGKKKKDARDGFVFPVSILGFTVI